MLDQHHPVVGHPEHARLLERLVDEGLRPDRSGCDAVLLEPHHVVHTARHERASIGEALDDELRFSRQLLHELGRCRSGERRLRVARGLCAAVPQQPLDFVEELGPARLRDVEQRNSPASQVG